MKSLQKHLISLSVLGFALAAALLAVIPAFGWFSGVVTPIKVSTPVQGAYFESGTGIQSDPYVIANPTQLYYFGWLQNMGYFNGENAPVHFTVSADLDMSGFILPPAGTKEFPFIGSFDGGSHTISGLTVRNQTPGTVPEDGLTDIPVDGPSDPQIVGFFGVIGSFDGGTSSSQTGTVKNFNLDGAVIRTVQPADQKTIAGIAAGYVNGTIQNVGVVNSRITIGSGLTNLDSGITANFSDSTLVGYAVPVCRTSLEIATVKIAPPSATASTFLEKGLGQDWGDSIPMRILYNRLTEIQENTPLTKYTYQKLYEIENGHWNDFSKPMDILYERQSPFRCSNYEKGGSFCFAPTASNNSGGQFVYLSGNRSKEFHTDRYGVYIHNDATPAVHISGKAEDGNVYYLSLNEAMNKIISTKAPTTAWFLDGNNIYATDKYGILHYVAAENMLSITTDGPHARNSWKPQFSLPEENKPLVFPEFGYNYGAAPTDPKPDGSKAEAPFSDKYHFTLRKSEAGETSPDGSPFTWDVSLPPDTSGPASIPLLTISSKMNSTEYFMVPAVDPANPNKGTVSAAENPGTLFWNYEMASGSNVLRIYATIEGVNYYLDQSLELSDNYSDALPFTVKNKVDTDTYGSFRTILTTDSNMCINTAKVGQEVRWALTGDLEDNAEINFNLVSGEDNSHDTRIGDPVTEITFTRTTACSYMRQSMGAIPAENATRDTYFPLSVIQDSRTYEVSPANTGYVISGSNADKAGSIMETGDIRVARYPINKSLSTSVQLSPDKKYEPDNVVIFTRNAKTEQDQSLAGKYVAVSDQPGSVSLTIDGKERNFSRWSSEKLAYSKFDYSKQTMDRLMTDTTAITYGYAYGMHFMNSLISTSHLVTAPYALMNGLPGSDGKAEFHDFQMPQDCIDFTVQEKGFLNFFAGSYYPGNKSFFSLHQIIRDPSTHKITKIQQIYKICKKTKDPKADYVYIFKEKGKIPAGCELVFDTAWLTKPDEMIQNAMYYFEIPVNKGEYALGSTNSNGAYLIYLDISASASVIHQTQTTELSTVVTDSFRYPAGVTLNPGSQSLPAVGMLPDAGVDYTLSRDGTGMAFLKDQRGKTLYFGKDAILRKCTDLYWAENDWAFPPDSTTSVTTKTVVRKEENMSTKAKTIKTATITLTQTDDQEPVTEKTFFVDFIDPKTHEPVRKEAPFPADIDATIAPVTAPLASYHYGYGSGVSTQSSIALDQPQLTGDQFPPLGKNSTADITNLLTSYTLSVTAISDRQTPISLFTDFLSAQNKLKITLNGAAFTPQSQQELIPQKAG